MAINARGTFLCYKHAAVQMVVQGRGGRIIGASSIAGKMGCPAAAAYSASKFAIRGLTQTAGKERTFYYLASDLKSVTTPALELGRYNITVNAFAPGIIDPSMCTRHDVSSWNQD